jgi:hypothetical protein
LLLAPELAPPSGRKRFRETITRRFAAMACFGANAVVLVVSGVPLTLRAAYATRFRTCADLRAQEADVPFSLSRHDLSRRLTDDGAIQAERDALDELRHFGLGKRIVGARGAGLRTLDARRDTRDHQGFVGFLDLLASVEVQHSPNQLLRALRCCHGRHSRMKAFDEISRWRQQQQVGHA